ncbi:hypothetical protein BABINDRAFT_15327 [Babjeviella inositovora NRRL Y-12698]|uniref:Phosducin domain-containing protein n=1 Tax=Babjeviella inositovora NRRL Y-12698 TaxID=984486 RepID=A0A1E3QJI2_9ASCO|nr:uncharacterized protein BABINDRAFT_15327 [Babjeviella inositovora NRRL Y-12698]ODQ77624.1 hypothetical protein BABINDRAFT_15327 [Babjeviella inositovora NRRL Y-12698]
MNIPDIPIPVEIDESEDTEWNDILRAKGIIPQRAPSPTAELEEALAAAVQRQHENRLEDKELDELAELEDEEDEEFLNFYKHKRMQEIAELQSRSAFGAVVPVAKPDYGREITEASRAGFVFCHMSALVSLQSRVLGALQEQLARKYPELKFCDIAANRAVENYPEANCPTWLVYRNGDVVKQYITLTQLGGNATTLRDVEKVLVDVEAVKSSDSRLVMNQEDEDEQEGYRMRFQKKSLRGKGSDVDSEDDFYD